MGVGGELLCEINAGLSLKPDVHGGSVRARGCRVRGEGETWEREGGLSGMMMMMRLALAESDL